MRYLWPHIQAILNTYKGALPLAHFLKGYFKANPKLGSRDRKYLSAMAYSWYRSSKGIAQLSDNFEERVALCLRACNTGITMPGVNINHYPLTIDLPALFPHELALSAGISKAEWLGSMLQQPDLFIRVRHKKTVEQALTQAGVPYCYVGDNCMALPNGAKIDSVLPADAYVVQDASSQLTGQYFDAWAGEQWWDCCSGAGGKSLLLMDQQPAVQLTVTDRRESILHNLVQRFRQYGLKKPTTITADIANAAAVQQAIGSRQFDNIICDAPCSGSGTWARTPEQMYFFDPKKADEYAELQTAIATNAASFLRPGGRLIYITCSVFTKENETVAAAVAEATKLSVQSMDLINGSERKADSMFAVVLQ